MHHLPQRGGTVRKSLRPSLELVERRRREQSESPPAPWWPSSLTARTAAACVICGCALTAMTGLASLTNLKDGSTVEPASAATLPAALAAKISRAEPIAVHARKFVVAPHHATSLPARAIDLGPGRDAHPAQTTSPPSGFTNTTGTNAPIAQAGTTSLLAATPWTLTAEGQWTTTVTLAVPAGIDPKKLDLQWSSDQADVLPLDASAPNAPGAIVTIGDSSSDVAVVVTDANAALGRQAITIAKPVIGPLSFQAVARAVGPHLVAVGWTPLVADIGVTEYKIYRRQDGSPNGVLVANVSPSGRTWQDTSVAANTAYGYSVIASTSDGGAKAWTGAVQTPAALQGSSFDAISGKGMFLYFVPNASDANSYAKYDPDAVIARARASGISHIEIRMARGTFVENATPPVHAWLDALIDKAAGAGIKLIAWQVPRRATAADAATAVAAAEYTTAAGNGFAGLALDIEDGDNYMGTGEEAKQRMVDHIEMVREAVGPDYLIVATVISPALTHWTNARYPFARIAPYASVMQPMEYWHHFYSSTGHAYTQDEVASACANSVALTRQQAGRDIPINVAGQSDDLGATGPPAPDEITWCLGAAKNAGAIGQTFFDWRGTDADDWSAIAGFAWSPDLR